jgi:hypothetical protein
MKTFAQFVVETAEPTLWGKFSVCLSAGHISQAETIMRSMTNPSEKESAATALTARKKYFTQRGIKPR